MKAPVYTLLLLSAALICGMIAVFAPLTRAAIGCNHVWRPGAFFAYCHENIFSDYEHAAYYFNLEPTAVNALRDADVIALGNSQIQFALSTDATSQFFSDHKLRHYLFGFGFGEGYVFPLSVIEKQKIHAKVYIINAVDFFADYASPVAVALQSNPDVFFQNFRRKVAGQVASLACLVVRCGPDLSFDRARADGHWLWRGSLHDPLGKILIPVPTSSIKALPSDAEVKAAGDIISRLGVPRECIIITATRTPYVDPTAYAAALGQQLGTSVAIPRLDGLRTIDGAHLDEDSAQRWSEAFFQLAADAIQRCI